MVRRSIFFLLVLCFLTSFLAGCNFPGVIVTGGTQQVITPPSSETPESPGIDRTTQLPTELPTRVEPGLNPTVTIESIFDDYSESVGIGMELTIDYLRSLEIRSSEITIESKTADKPDYTEYIASYLSEGNRIYGLLTIPTSESPEGGFPAIVFNHGYIPPEDYNTTERYIDYVDFLAQRGFVVFKIDYRGHGRSEGEPNWGYFSPGYTIDTIIALKSLQLMDFVNSGKIGMWGHSMGGNVVLRAMLIEPDIQAGVIWAGAVYSYDDFMRYSIGNPTYTPARDDLSRGRQMDRAIFDIHGPPDTNDPYWRSVSLTENIEYLRNPVQIHHAEDDTVVNIGYSQDLTEVLLDAGKNYEFYIYTSGGHNIAEPYFELAMQRTVDFFHEHLKSED